MNIDFELIMNIDPGAELKAAIEESLMKIGERGAEKADANAPIDTGLLHNSITYALGGKPPAKQGYSADSGGKTGTYSGTHGGTDEEVYIGTNVKYAPYVEFGHGVRAESGMGGNPKIGGVPANPFLRSALEGSSKDFEVLAATAFQRHFGK